MASKMDEKIDAEKGAASVSEHVPLPTALPIEEESTKLNFQTIMAFLALCGQFNAYVFTLLIPSTVLSYINADLGPDPNYVWITVSWQLGAACLVSIGGRLSDIFGRRYFMLTGSCLSIVGCLVGATAQSINQMIASGVIFGVASGFQETAYACIQEIIPNSYRMYGVGIFDASLIIAYLSPMISYAFIATVSISWRAAYWYMFSFHTVMGIFLFVFYRPPNFHMKHRIDGKTKRDLLLELDYVGLVLFAMGTTLFLIGINFGGRKLPWNSAGVIAPMIIGVALLVTLSFWERRPQLKYPLLPPKLFKRIRGFVMVIVVCFVGGMLYYSMNVLWPQESGLLFVPANQPLIRGAYANIFSFGSFLGALIMMFFCAKVHHERWQLVGFITAQTVLISSLATVGINDKVQAICTVLFGAAMVTPPQLISFTMLSLGIDDQTDIGIAVGLAGTFRLMGGAVATAIYTAILSGTFGSQLPDQISSSIVGTNFSAANLPALIAAAKVNTAAAYKVVPGITDAVIAAAQLAVKLAYVQAFRTVYLTAIGFGVLAIIAAFCTISTDMAMKTNERAVILRNDPKAEKVYGNVDI